MSKIQYHGAYTPGAQQAMSGTMNIGNSLANIKVPALVLKADANEDVRKSNEEVAKVIQSGKLIHVEGSRHNLHHDKLEATTEALKTFFATHKLY